VSAAVPITAIAGYLGAGKTTLLNRVLNCADDLRGVAILVNDFGDVNIDADLIRDQAPDGEIIALTNGCICCSIQDDFTAGLENLQEMPLDQVLLEASGVAAPAKLRYQCAYPGYRLHICVVVIDAVHHPQQREDKYVGNLVREQVAQADVLAISKWDSAPDFAPEFADKPQYDAADPALLELLLKASGLPAIARTDANPLALDEPEPTRFCTYTLRQHEDTTGEDLQRLINALPATVQRVKGFAHVAGATMLVQKVGATTNYESYPTSQPGRLVIVSAESMGPETFADWRDWRLG